jgi:hypothetical protein
MSETINKIKEWGEKNEHTRAIILIGSHAREHNRADRWSDIDVMLFTTRPRQYQHDNKWLEEIGPLLSCYSGLEVAGGTFVKRVFFTDGVEMDITPIPASAIDRAYAYAKLKKKLPFVAISLPASVTAGIEKPIRSFAYYIHRGMRVLVDKKDYKAKIEFIESSFKYQPPGPPTLSEFELHVEQFWQTAFRMAVKLSRKEFFTARYECEAPMKLNLLTMMEWHAKSLHGWQFETWHKGRFIEKWAEPEIVAGLRGIYGRYDEKDSWESLFNTMNLFQKVSHEVESRLGYQYNKVPEQYLRRWIEDIHTQVGETAQSIK